MLTLYDIEDLGDLGGSLHQSVAYGINNSGEVVGSSWTATEEVAFVWRNATTGMQSLPMLSGSVGSAARGINDSGLIVGYSDGGMLAKRRATVWSGGTMAHEIPLPLASTSNQNQGSEARGVNENGDVCGAYLDRVNVNTEFSVAFVWDTAQGTTFTNVATTIPAASGFAGSGAANAINAQGTVAGNYISNLDDGPPGTDFSPYNWNAAWASTPLLVTPFGVTAVPPDSTARGINDANESVGEFWGNGFFSVLVPTPGVILSWQLPIRASAINNNGLIVGVKDLEGACTCVVNSPVVRLSAVQGVRRKGWQTLLSANAVNDHGQIVGQGINAAGHHHAYRLTPVPVRKPPIHPRFP